MDTSNRWAGLAFGALCVAAIVAALAGFALAGGAMAALAAAVILLVAGQVVLYLLLTQSRQDRPQPEVMSGLEAINTRLARMEAQLAAGVKAPMLDQPEAAAALPPTPGPAANSNLAAPRDSKRSEAPAPSGPAFLQPQNQQLYLEPVVDARDLKTAHYRAELAFKPAGRPPVPMSHFAEDIARADLAADVDMAVFERLGPIVDRLAAKGTLTGVICPVSRASFASSRFLEALTVYLQSHQDLARIVIFEISQGELANLSQDGMAGLAYLAQAGATFSLGKAGLESPDLASLASLGFRYLDLDIPANISRYGMGAFSRGGLAEKLRTAVGQHDIRLVASGIVRKSQFDMVNNLVHFARGQAFSPPRLVRMSSAHETGLSDAA